MTPSPISSDTNKYQVELHYDDTESITVLARSPVGRRKYLIDTNGLLDLRQREHLAKIVAACLMFCCYDSYGYALPELERIQAMISKMMATFPIDELRQLVHPLRLGDSAWDKYVTEGGNLHAT